MVFTWKITELDCKPYKVDFRAVIRELAILSDLMGKEWLHSTTMYKVAKMVLKTPNNPILEIDTDYRMELIGETYEIMQHNGGIWLKDYIPQINEICCLIGNKIRYWSIDPENPNRKENKHD